MSFDLHFQTCRFDGTTEKRTNPFTRQLQDIPRNEPLSEAEVQAVLSVLRKAGAARPPGHDFYAIRCPDGGGAEVFGEDLRSGCMFAIRGAGVTPALAQLLFEVMVAGNWVIMGEEDLVIAPSKECLKGTPRGFGQVVVAASGEEVGALLAGGFEAWKAFRNKALRGRTDG